MLPVGWVPCKNHCAMLPVGWVPCKNHCAMLPVGWVPCNNHCAMFHTAWVRPLGCWTDRASRAIQPLEGTDPLLSDSYQSRQEPLQKCYSVSRDLGYSVFALQNGGWCASTATAQDTYRMYGASSGCQADGEGGGYANEVYEIIDEDHNPYRSSFLSNARSFQCGSEATMYVISGNESSIGQILSPRHGGGSYPASSACSWLIGAGETGQISLNFTQFSLENSSACSDDYVAIYDGPGTSSQLLGKFCGTDGPGVVNSTAGYLLVVFRSDNSLEFRGFEADITTRTVSTTIPECYPDISLAGGGPTMDQALPVERPVPFTIQAITDVTCNETYSVEFQWMVYSYIDGLLQWTDVSVPSNYQEIFIPKNTLHPGLVRLDLNATVVVERTGARNSLVEARWVEIVLSPLVTSITGGSARAVSRLEDLVLSATDSYDPNGIVTDSADLNFTWSCLEENGRHCSIFPDGGRQPQYTVPPSSLPASDNTLNISVSASFGRQTASPFQQRVELRNGTVLEVEIIGCSQTANPSERLVLRTACRNCPSSSTSYHWSLLDLPREAGMEGGDWTGLLSTSSTSPSLVVKANSLKIPGSYRIRVDVSAPEEAAGFAECAFNMNSAPESGTCVIQPMSVSEEFSVICEGFSDANTPLVYSLYQKSDSSDGSLQFLSSWPDGRMPALQLPVGSPSRNFTCDLEVHVSDARGAVLISNTMSVQVPLPSEEETYFLLGNLSSTLDRLIGSGDTRGLLNIVHRVSSILNADTFPQHRKNTASEARRTMTRKVQMIAEQMQTLEGYRQLSTVITVLTAAADQITAEVQADVVEMMMRVVTYFSSQPKEILGPERLEEAARSVFIAAANIISSSLVLSNVSNSTSAHRQELQQATMSAIGAAEGLSEAILSRKTPDEAATSYSMTGSTITLGKYRLLQPTMPLVFRTNNQSSSFVAVRNITALIGEANSAIHSIGAMNLLTRSRLYADAGDSEKVQSTVSRLRLFTDSGPLQTGNSGPLQTGSGNAPIEAVSERLEQFPVVEHPGTTEPPWKYAMQVHSFNVTEPGSSLHISLSELSRDVPVRLYLRRAKLPSREEFDRNITISTQAENTPYSVAFDETTVLRQDRYTWFVPPDDVTAVGGPGEFTVGVEHVPYAGNVTTSPDVSAEEYSHVNFTLNYKITLFTTNCLSFNETSHRWASDDCRAGPLTTTARSHCYCNRLATFSSGFTFYHAERAVIPLEPPTPECFPGVTLSGGGVDQSAALAVERRVPLTIQSTLVISCNESYTVAFHWQVFHYVMGHVEPVSLPVPADSADITIPKNTLMYGLVKIELNATVNINRTGDQNSLQGEQWVEVSPAPLVALIAGGSARAVGKRGTLVLNASSSYDPDGIITDHTDFNYTWTCQGENGTVCNSVFEQEESGPSFSIPASSLPTESAIFNFSVHISSGTRTSATFSQTVELKDGEVLNVLISCFVNCNDRINPSERLVLVTSCDNCPPDTVYSWSLRDSPTTFGRDDLDWVVDTATGRSAQDLVVKANVLNVPGDYTLRLDVMSTSGSRGLGGAGFTEARVNVNEPPTPGTCSVSPASGTTASTLFSVSCRGFQDTDRPLIYALYYSDGQTTAFRALFSGPQSELPPTLLPVGQESRDFNVTLQVRVSDAFGAVAYSNNMTAQVQLPSAEETVAALGNLSSNIDNLLDSGNSQGVVQLASSIGSVLNTPGRDATNESRTAAQKARTKLVTALEAVEVQTVENINLLAGALGQVTAADDQVTPDAQVSSSSIALKMSQVLSSQSVQDLGAEGLEESAGNVLSVVVNTLQASSTSASAQRRSGSVEDGTTQLAKNQQATTTMFAAMENVNGAILDRKTPDESQTAFDFGTFGIAVNKERCSATSSAPKITRTSDTSLNFFVVPSTSTLLGGSCGGESSVGTENFQSKKNPYAYSGSSDAVQSSVNGLTVRGQGGPLAVSRLSEPVQIVTERAEGLPAATETGSTVPSWQQAMSMHSFNVTEAGSSIHITVLSVEQNVSLRLYLRRNDRPTRTNFDLNTTLPRPYSEVFKVQLGNNQSADQSTFNWFISADEILNVGGVGEFTVGVDHVPYTEAGRTEQSIQSDYSHVNFTTNYTMQIFTTTCLFFDEVTQQWKSDGCKAGPLTSDRLSHCFCDHLTSFGSGFTFFVAPNSLNILQALQGFLNIGENPAVVICISVIFGLYLLLVIWGRHKDKEDARKVGATLLRASRRGHDNFYRIMVFTGPRASAGTTARVSLKLFGESGEAGPVVLEDLDRVTFQQGAVDTFVLSAGCRLGALSAVHVWHDNTGGDPSWYLNKIVVLDCDNDDKYTFVCERWLAVEEGDGQVDRLLPVATEKDLTSIGKVFSSKTSKDFRDGHLWFSVLGRPAYSSFTRVQRLSCCLSLLLCTMLTNIMFFGKGETFAKPPPVDILGFEVQFPLSWGQIIIAVESALIVFPVNLAIVQIFRYCGQRPRKERRDGIKKTGKPNSDNIDSASTASQSTASTASIEFGNTLGEDDVEVMVHNFSSPRDKSAPPIAGSKDDWLFHKLPYHNTTGESIQMVERTWIGQNDKNATEARREKKKGRTLLPWWCVFFAYFLVFASCFLSAFFTMLYGFEYGRAKAEAWLITFLTSFFIDLLFTQPIKIVLLAVFFALIFRRMDSEDEEVPTGQLEDDEIYMAADMENWSMPTSTETNPPTPEELAESRAQRFRELTVRSAFKELLFYVLFIAVLVIVANGPRDSMMYYQTKHLHNTFLSGGGNHSLQKATSYEKFWKFTELALVPEISPTSWYNGMTFQPDGYLSDHQSYIVGTVRFRQLRVKQDEHCTIQKPFIGLINNCDVEYSYFMNEDRHYTEGWEGPANVTDDPPVYENYTEQEQPWLYHEPTLYDIPTSGRYAVYYGGGYVAELTNTTPAALLSTLERLQSSGWIDQHTRAVFVQFTVFNPNTNLFSIMELMTEFPTLGSTCAKVEATTVRLYRFQTIWAKVVAAFQGVFVLFTLYFVFREFSRIMLLGWGYFKMFWNCLELSLALLSLAEIGILLYTLYLMLGFNAPQRATEAAQDSYEKYRQAALWDQVNTYVLGWLVCVATLKLLHLFRFNKHIVRGADTMKKAAGPLTGFGIVFITVFCAFTMLFFLVVGTKLEGFANFASALQTILVIIQSASSYYVIAEASSVLGPIAYFALLGLFHWVMLLMFVAILDDAYHESMAEQKGGKTENEKVADMMIQRVKTAALTVASCGRRENRSKTYEVRRRPTEQELLDIFNGPELIRMVEEKSNSNQTFEFVLDDLQGNRESTTDEPYNSESNTRKPTAREPDCKTLGYNPVLLSEQDIADVFVGPGVLKFQSSKDSDGASVVEFQF
ncbi:uncharacterized protein LOC118420093 [Branchiostoma floridae]|uniref:Uncharacterized protein LOC118420093 n=3 Tax=Branchiostoma floridae TaxID=7739 RepID=A0A9J7LGX3_BRAFL|nr:uncharacterized protein LOC118420093 [Branchiostoma floridae]